MRRKQHPGLCSTVAAGTALNAIRAAVETTACTYEYTACSRPTTMCTCGSVVAERNNRTVPSRAHSNYDSYGGLHIIGLLLLLRSCTVNRSYTKGVVGLGLWATHEVACCAQEIGRTFDQTPLVAAGFYLPRAFKPLGGNEAPLMGTYAIKGHGISVVEAALGEPTTHDSRCL